MGNVSVYIKKETRDEIDKFRHKLQKEKGCYISVDEAILILLRRNK